MNSLDTKLRFARALNDALRSKPLSKVCVTDVCRAAGLSRTAFYQHFQDIYSLSDWLWHYACRDILDGIGDSYGWTEGHKKVFDFMLDNKDYYLNTEKPPHTTCFLTASDRSLALQIYGSKIEKRLGRPITEKESAMLQYISFMYASMVHKWIREGMELPTEYLAELVNGLVPDFIVKTLGR